MVSRRTFSKMALLATPLVAACSKAPSEGQAKPEEEVGSQTEAEVAEAPVAETASGTGATLVVFFSRADENYAEGGTEVLEVGHTKVMADYVAQELGADTYEIVPQEPYPFSYDECCDVASQELADDARPALAGELPDVSAYDTVFLGCPIWWGSEPMVVRSFLDGVDLTGKTVVPFTTHGGSGLGSVPENLRERIGGASFLEAKAVAGTDVDGARDEVVEWVRSLGL